MKIVALTPFPILPANFGGAERCLNLLSRVGDITTIALNWEGSDAEGLYHDMRYRMIGADPEAIEQSKKLFGRALSTQDGMAAATKAKLKKLTQAIAEEAPDLIILEHPWLYPFVGDTPFIYDAHNAEAFLTSLRWPGSIDEQIVRELEQAAVTKAKAITYCSELDAEILRKTYNPTAPMHYIANGTDLPDNVAEGKTKNLIFIGSIYGPNVRAAQELVNQAEDLKGYTIQILGGCANMVRTTARNVELVGVVTDSVMNDYFTNAYAFVNLMQTGSGTSLKLGRAMSYGLPVISTEIGARGYPGVIKVSVGEPIRNKLTQLKDEWEGRANASRDYAETISWDRVGNKFSKVVRSV
jgi:glycosyltransferase involved in cell wall biosynthesis